MSILELSRGYWTIVDFQDACWGFINWSAVKCGKKIYAFRKRRGDGLDETQYLHLVIASLKFGDIPGDIQVDHINGNSLDNRRANLRLATHRQNLANRGPASNNTTGFKGISKHRSKWYASINTRSYRKSASFETAIQAAHQYDQWAREEYGEFAWLNFPDERDDSNRVDDIPEPDPRPVRFSPFRASPGERARLIGLAQDAGRLSALRGDHRKVRHAILPGTQAPEGGSIDGSDYNFVPPDASNPSSAPGRPA